MSAEPKRCAIYTRKSHEEGLEQEFNSLDAQREAGEDYVKSQRHEGWHAVATQYDDGGYSGGNTDRPALKQLMLDIGRGEIDVVVVYKVDRLSRSLSDFAQLMKVFDERGVSFVSVTQQFNTTTSMGRLTLNMLLSFAQFEREVTGERIRDKIAASKRRGLWMSGQPPLGYRAVDKRLVIVPDEAELVREIFRGYLASGSRTAVCELLNKKGRTTKRWTSPSSGRTWGGRPPSAVYIDKVLNNPVYIGKLTHKGEALPGTHEPIIDQALWERVRAAIDSKSRRERTAWSHPYLLKGKLKTDEGFCMSPSHVTRPTSKNKRRRKVRYYVSQKAIRHGYASCAVKNVNTEHLDELVRALVLDELRTRGITGLATLPDEKRDLWLRTVIERVEIGPLSVRIELSKSGINECSVQPWSGEGAKSASAHCVYSPDVEDDGQRILMSLAIRMKNIDGRRLILAPDGQDLILPSCAEPKQHIVDAIGRAYRLHETLIASDTTVRSLADERGLDSTRLYRYLQLTQLSPRIVKLALTGKLSPRIALRDLYDAGKILHWEVQESMLGLDQRSARRTETESGVESRGCVVSETGD